MGEKYNILQEKEKMQSAKYKTLLPQMRAEQKNICSKESTTDEGFGKTTLKLSSR